MGLRFQADLFYIAGYMARGTSLGEFEQIVLLAILRLADGAYGVTIGREIAQCTGRAIAPGAMYTTLERLERKKLVRSWLGEATPQRGGRAKRYFAVTRGGVAAVAAAQRAYKSLLQGVVLPGGANA